MKKLLKYILVLVLMVFSSCEDILDLKPESSLGYTSFWDTEDGAKAAQVALHANFKNFQYKNWFLGEVRSDIWGGATVQAPNDLAMIEHDITITNIPASVQSWAGFYSYLHVVNDIIKNAPNVTYANESDKFYILGQAYGFRAYIYYILLKTWGDVPLVLEPTVVIDFENIYIARTPASEVMVQIKKDIQSSLDNFADNNTFQSSSKVYWSKAASLTLKGDVYIWAGTHLEGGATDYTTAKQALQAVIDMGTLDLLPNFSDVFNYSKKNNKEIIFALSYAIDQGENAYSNFVGNTTSLASYYMRNGTPMSTLILDGENRYGPSNELLSKWTDFTDSRNDATLRRIYSNNDASGYLTSVLAKFNGTISSGEQLMVDDVPIYRYADVLLLLAEAKNLLEEDPSPEINKLRQRAYGSNYPGHEYSNSTKEVNTEAILDERLYEFIGEGKRWFDLRRAGDEWVFKYIKFLEPTTDSYKLLLPVTREMISRNPLLTQTPGYIY